jgi:DoxX-like family
MNTDNDSISKGRRIAGNVLMFLGGFVLVASSIAKLAHVPKVVNELGAMGFDGNRLLMIAIVELASALLFVLPLTRSAGLLLVSSYMGGAIATHVQHSQPFIQPAIILALMWVGIWLRNPQVLWSLEQASSGGQFVPMRGEAGAQSHR